MGIAHLRRNAGRDAAGHGMVHAEHIGAYMSNVIQLDTGIESNARDTVDQIAIDLAHLDDMFWRYPEIMAKHEAKLEESIGRFYRIMGKIAKYNEINKGADNE